MPVMTYREALRSAMADEMERDESVVLLGEDIGVYGGISSPMACWTNSNRRGHRHADLRGRVYRRGDPGWQ